MIKISWASNEGPVHTRQIYSDKLQNFVFARISLIRLDAIGINPDKNHAIRRKKWINNNDLLTGLLGPY